MAYQFKPCRDCGRGRTKDDKGCGIRCIACGQARKKEKREPILRDYARDALITSAFKSGSTYQDISAAFGISASRARELVLRNGIDPIEFDHVRVAGRSKAPQTKGEDWHQRSRIVVYGCAVSEVLALNDGKRLSDRTSKAHAYLRQKTTARARGIDWQFTFPEWVRVWADSGKFEARGRNGFVMARHGDVGPYAKDNVYITSCAQNSADAAKFRRQAGFK